MFATIMLTSLLASLAFLAIMFVVRHLNATQIRLQRVPVPVLAEQEIRRRLEQERQQH